MEGMLRFAGDTCTKAALHKGLHRGRAVLLRHVPANRSNYEGDRRGSHPARRTRGDQGLPDCVPPHPSRARRRGTHQGAKGVATSTVYCTAHGLTMGRGVGADWALACI